MKQAVRKQVLIYWRLQYFSIHGVRSLLFWSKVNRRLRYKLLN